MHLTGGLNAATEDCIERWVEVAGERARERPRGRDTWMLERQIAIIADVVKLHRKSAGATRH